MIELIVGIVLAVFIVKLIKAENNTKPETKYDEIPDDVKMTYEEWEALEDTDKPLEATKEKWKELNKEEKITKDEYETQKAAFLSSSME